MNSIKVIIDLTLITSFTFLLTSFSKFFIGTSYFTPYNIVKSVQEDLKYLQHVCRQTKVHYSGLKTKV